MNLPRARDMDWSDLERVGTALGQESHDINTEHFRNMKMFIARLLHLLTVGEHEVATRVASSYVMGVYPDAASAEVIRSCVIFDFSAALEEPPGEVSSELMAPADRVERLIAPA